MSASTPQLTRREFRATVPRILAALRRSDPLILVGLHANQAQRKNDGSEVTRADKGAERVLRRELGAAWPADPVYGEEYGGALVRQGRCWLVDPIDGTASYVIGMPMFGTLLSLVIDGEPVFGCVHLPALRETTFAAIGHGCWYAPAGRTARRVRVAASRPLSDAKVGMTAFKERGWLDKPGAREVAGLAWKVGRLRMVGDCVQYPLVCRGVLDAAIDPLMKPWDVGAVVPCVVEAGGSISDLNGDTRPIIDRTSIVAASSATLRRAICRAVRV